MERLLQCHQHIKEILSLDDLTSPLISKGDGGPTGKRGNVGFKVVGNSLYSVSISLLSLSRNFSIDVWDLCHVNLAPSLEQPLLCTTHKTLSI